MTPGRLAVVLLTFVLAALLAVGMWGGGNGTAPRSNDDYIAIAISDPRIFHPTGPSSGRQVVAENVERNGSTVIVTVISDGDRFKVYIDARTDRVTNVERQP